MRAFIKFGIVGLSGVVVNAGVYNLLLFAAFFSTHYLLANTIAFLIAVTNNFYWNFRWTFKGRAQHRTVSQKYIRFVLISLCGFAVNTILLGVMVHHIALNKRLANIIAIGATCALNFMGNYLITFRDR